eukprot:m51a1_g7935 hypothetical protein (394) ;mRNA; r:61727-67333
MHEPSSTEEQALWGQQSPDVPTEMQTPDDSAEGISEPRTPIIPDTSAEASSPERPPIEPITPDDEDEHQSPGEDCRPAEQEEPDTECLCPWRKRTLPEAEAVQSHRSDASEPAAKRLATPRPSRSSSSGITSLQRSSAAASRLLLAQREQMSVVPEALKEMEKYEGERLQHELAQALGLSGTSKDEGVLDQCQGGEEPLRLRLVEVQSPDLPTEAQTPYESAAEMSEPRTPIIPDTSAEASSPERPTIEPITPDDEDEHQSPGEDGRLAIAEQEEPDTEWLCPRCKRTLPEAEAVQGHRTDASEPAPKRLATLRSSRSSTTDITSLQRSGTAASRSAQALAAVDAEELSRRLLLAQREQMAVVPEALQEMEAYEAERLKQELALALALSGTSK